MAACCFAKVRTTAFTIILPHSAPAPSRDIAKLRTQQPSEFANSLPSRIRFVEWIYSVE